MRKKWVSGLISLLAATSCTPPDPPLAYSSLADDNWEIYRYDPATGRSLNLTRHAAPDQDPQWQPHHARILFTSLRDHNAELYLINADGSNLSRLTHHPAWDQDPCWSPDGQQIAFSSDRDGNRELYLSAADGSQPRRLTRHPAADSEPAWSPDGQRLVFVSNRAGQPDLYLLELASLRVTPLLIRPQQRAQQPVWSPDGRQIAFIAVNAGHSILSRIQAEGSALTALTPPELVALSPVWRSRNQLFFSGRQNDETLAVYQVDAQGRHLRRWLSGPADLLAGSLP